LVNRVIVYVIEFIFKRRITLNFLNNVQNEGKMGFSTEMYMMQGFTTDQETAMDDLYGNIENTRRFNTCMNSMAIRIATVFASLKVLPTHLILNICN